ncbi:LysM peptidoglycan-binding domain-containing protein [Lacisediminihabitans sp.]|uniref:LysM peptidoglycan-binding domain-containing protein n=1 Tax=Lacisediminihabitans sp. TaxID=2787631 RepID=UPI00374D89C1
MSTIAMNQMAFGTTARADRAPAVHLRLTRRGRVVLTSLAAVPLVIGALVFAINGGSAVATGQVASTSFDYVTVEPGQSLWQLAETVAPSADIRDVVADIVHLNRLESTNLQPGQKIAIPTQYSH